MKNAARLYLLLIFLTRLGMSFITATYAMYLMAKGLSLLQLNLVNLVFCSTLLLCEIPTGAIADIFGRRPMYILSCFLVTASMFTYALSDTFLGFAFAEFLCAVGGTFANGAFQAWLVDELKFEGKEKSLPYILSKDYQLRYLALFIGAPVGAYLGGVDLAFPWICGGILYLTAAIVSLLFIHETNKRKNSSGPREICTSIKKVISSGFGSVSGSGPVTTIIFLTFLLSLSTQGLNIQWQPYFSKMGCTRFSLGILAVAMSVFLAIGSRLSTWLMSKKGPCTLLIFVQVQIGAFICLTAMTGSFFLSSAFFMFHEFGRGIYGPVKDSSLNQEITSDNRATILSFDSMGSHMGSMLGLVISGILAQYGSIEISWLVSGSFLCLANILLFYKLKK